jgi:flagellar assembly protein FliH
MPRILKAPPTTEAAELSAFAFDDLTDSARSHLLAARRETTELLAAARQEAERIRRQAEQDGRAAAEGAMEQIVADRVAAQVAMVVPALERAVSDIQTARAACLGRWESAALGVATAIAARVIRREVAHVPEISLSLVREALELAAGSSDLQLRMHPDDVAALGTQVESLLGQLARRGREALIADAAITRGGCRVDTRAGSIDQQFEAQLARIEQELR